MFCTALRRKLFRGERGARGTEPVDRAFQSTFGEGSASGEAGREARDAKRNYYIIFIYGQRLLVHTVREGEGRDARHDRNSAHGRPS